MATYDPNKTYTWGPDTKFVISGQDFSLLLHTLRGILSTKEATNTVLAYEMNKKVEAMMADAVAEGKVKEAEMAPPSPINDIPVTEYEEITDVPNLKTVK
jgi:hypothetical protein